MNGEWVCVCGNHFDFESGDRTMTVNPDHDCEKYGMPPHIRILRLEKHKIAGPAPTCPRCAALERELATAKAFGETMRKEYEAMARRNTALQEKLNAMKDLAQKIHADALELLGREQ